MESGGYVKVERRREKGTMIDKEENHEPGRLQDTKGRGNHQSFTERSLKPEASILLVEDEDKAGGRKKCDPTRYVIDTGYVKQRQYNPSTGMYSLDVVQISSVDDHHALFIKQLYDLHGLESKLISVLAELEELVPESVIDYTPPASIMKSSSMLPFLKFRGESLADALRQLYLIDAIDENGMITHVGRTMAGEETELIPFASWAQSSALFLGQIKDFGLLAEYIFIER
ncbi:putative pre-mRNA-splicing factor ATP-dependent RNA helicase [Dendrobium catenatum]|uniref:Putative pre-mRNA-splicing factor ATP-dependent RNA helicase n=1 Tax=Dendrobium catenatum TaxID=906689 RepID=A0A2I0VZJ6_9ASPA|nr:putative pre-mRNA-splicing factor ATP-dependent RNA helicase [Dendrobium catenatum]